MSITPTYILLAQSLVTWTQLAAMEVGKLRSECQYGWVLVKGLVMIDTKCQFDCIEGCKVLILDVSVCHGVAIGD